MLRAPPGVTGARDQEQLEKALLLHAKVRECTACRLCHGRQNAVFGKGHLGASLLIVGEAPGQQEDIYGIPFCGLSGELLHSVLAEFDPEYEQYVFITNTVRCRTPDGRDPLPVEVYKCAPLLVETVTLVQPKAILALGNTASRMLSGQQVSNISRLRDKSQGLISFQGIPLRFAFHPAHIRRNPSQIGTFKKDIKEALAFVKS